MRSISLLKLGILSLAFPALSVRAQLVNLTAVDTGWYDSAGYHDATNPNYIAGLFAGFQFHDYFVFDLTGLSQLVSSASLTVYNPPEGFLGAGPLTVRLYDVSTGVPQLISGNAGGAGGIAIFNDLGSGTAFSDKSFNASTDNTSVTFTLNSAFLSYFDAHEGGLLAIGGAITSPAGYVFGFSGVSGPEPVLSVHENSFSAVPEASSYGVVAAVGLAGFAAVRGRSNSGTRFLRRIAGRQGQGQTSL